MRRNLMIMIGIIILLCPMIIYAADNVGLHGDSIAPVILGVTGIVFFAVVGRFIARLLNFPAVLGELLMGVLVGNILYWLGSDLFFILREGSAVFTIMEHVLAGETIKYASEQVLGNTHAAHTMMSILQKPGAGDLLKVAHVVDAFSRYGIIFLLFLVGLESSVSDLRKTGVTPIRVAIIGIVLPLALGFALTSVWFPNLPLSSDLFIGATLAATSIGITARALRDLQKINSAESRVILSAAVLDDILGLMLLAIITSVVVTGTIEASEIIRVVALASLFLVGAFLSAPYLLNATIWLLRHLTILEAKLFISFLFVMLMAWLANLVGLATIIGAFAAGLILHDGYFRHWGDVNQHQYTIKDLVAPLEAILAPIFFVLVGIQVKLETFMSGSVIAFAIALLIVAIIGKLVSGYGANKKMNRLAIGIGMIPRGEVGLIFATLGKSLGVVNEQIFASVVLMVVVTSFIAPPLLKKILR